MHDLASERNKDTTLGIRARFSYDGGLTWTREVILSYGLMPASNSSDWGYTSSVELSDGKIFPALPPPVGVSDGSSELGPRLQERNVSLLCCAASAAGAELGGALLGSCP